MIPMLTPSNHWPCRWCSWWLFSIIVLAVDTRTDFVVLPSLLLPLMLVLILPSCNYCRWFPYWFHHIDACNGCLAWLFLPLMPVLILPSCNSSRWFPCSLHQIIGLVVDARGGSLASLLSPLMSVLILSSFSYCSIVNCSWCSSWLYSIIPRVVDVHADFITSLLLQIVAEE